MLRSILALLALAAVTGGGIAQTTPPLATATSPSAQSPSKKITWSSVNADGPYIALTFDDGPHATNTPRLLEMLAKRNIKVTFFVIGQCVQDHPDILKRELAEGHEIGNHSWTHPMLSKMSESGVHNELQRTQDAIVQATGYTPKLMRPPYGALTEKQRTWVNNQFGYKIILWAVDPLDWKRPGPSVVAHRILSETRSGNIILMHDIHGGSIDAIPEIVDGLLAKGFKFVTVSQLLAMDRPGKPKPGASSAPSPSTPASATPSVAVPAVSAAPSAPVESLKQPTPFPQPVKKNDLPDSL